MNVKTTLAAQTSGNLAGEIVCIEPTADLAAATPLLSANRIGAVVTRGTGDSVVGI